MYGVPGFRLAPTGPLARKIQGVAEQSERAERMMGIRARKEEREAAALRAAATQRHREAARRVALMEANSAQHIEAARAIRAETAEKHGLTIIDMMSDSRMRSVAWPRQEAMYLTVRDTILSLPHVGKFYGNRDHTTVLHACRAHAERNNLPMPRGMTDPRLSKNG